MRAARLYATTDAQLTALLDDERREVRVLQAVLQEGNEGLRSLVSETEWNEIVNHRSKFLGIF